MVIIGLFIVAVIVFFIIKAIKENKQHNNVVNDTKGLNYTSLTKKEISDNKSIESIKSKPKTNTNTKTSSKGKSDNTEFNFVKERELLNDMHKANTEFELHLSYIALQDFYYKYRADEKYLNLCIGYCLKDIELLPKINKTYIDSQIKTIEELMPYVNAQEKEEYRKEKLKIQQNGFDCIIPAFKRMAIIEEKKKNYDQAIYYCNLAIDYYGKHNLSEAQAEFAERKNKLLAKKTK
ncbi:MAG: hypothetical protein ACI4F7_12200 [Acutalibacteraceae bacterium]